MFERIRTIFQSATGKAGKPKSFDNQSSFKFRDIDYFYLYTFDIGKPIDVIDAAKTLVSDPGEVGWAFYNRDWQRFELMPVVAGRVENLTDVASLLALSEDLKDSGYGKFLSQESLGRLTELFDELAPSVMQVESLLALYNFVDEEVLSDLYLDSNAFVRVKLTPFDATFGGQKATFDMFLLIHRAGICTLTAWSHGQLAGPYTPDQLAYMLRHEAKEVAPVTMQRVLLERTTALAYPFMSATEIKEMLDNIQTDDPYFVRIPDDWGETSLYSIFDAYRFYITEVIQGNKFADLDKLYESLRVGLYYAYPIVCVRATEPPVNTASELKARHARDLIPAMFGINWSDAFPDAEVEAYVANDKSRVETKVFYASEGSALIVYTGKASKEMEEAAQRGSSEDIEYAFQHLNSTIVIDILTLQRYILQMLDEQLSDIDGFDFKKLNELRRVVVRALDEYHNVKLTNYGSVKEMINELKAEWGVNDLYATTKEKLTLLDSFVALKESERRYARDRIITWVSLVVSTLLTFPTSFNIVNRIKSWPITNNYLVNYLVYLSNAYPIMFPLLIWGATVSIVLLTIFFEPIKRFPRVAVRSVAHVSRWLFRIVLRSLSQIRRLWLGVFSPDQLGVEDYLRETRASPFRFEVARTISESPLLRPDVIEREVVKSSEFHKGQNDGI